MVIESPLAGEDFFLVYSKVASDNMPITQTAVDNLVCMDPTRTIHQRNYYPTEAEGILPQCEFDEVLQTMEDPRYKALSFSMSEYEIYDQNDVYDLLRSFQFSEKYIRLQQFKDIDHWFKVRPTIPFKLECDSQGVKRVIL